ncbi:hypothetical protein [Fervidobacterium thailandense]|uniref:Uncharacterized protein n=1 Tax=Fervidobacterium thailandense TaxID=1008305 RepID=A0A1E3G4W2_9BACT|nr:hypothetical protein [Fervidobacterium thailandense]ODN31331.1 hypothetical protein A4H02_00765 [Fervidobacterium thailandense]
MLFKKFWIFMFTLFAVFSISLEICHANTIVIFPNYGLLYTSIPTKFELPSDWQILHVSASKWSLVTEYTPAKYLLPVELPRGVYQLKEALAITESGETYVNTPFGVAKLLTAESRKNVINSSEQAEALFKIPASHRIYYVLKGDRLEQYFYIFAAVDSAFVILSSVPQERGYVPMAKMMAAADESTVSGRKLFVIGTVNELSKGVNIRNKTIQVTRKDWNVIELNYLSSTDWQPADYVIDIKCGDELPGGEVYIYGTLLGRTIPLGSTIMGDINKEGSIYVSKSWDVFYNWSLGKITRVSGRNVVTGTLILKGQGAVKIVIRAKNIADLKISTGRILRQSGDFVEVELNLSGTAKLDISFSYSIE